LIRETEFEMPKDALNGRAIHRIGILDLEDRRENFAIDPRNLPHNLRDGSSAALTP
jgi:hypothetical protein